MAEQLPLPLPSHPALGRDDFYASPANAAALSAVENPAQWPGGRLAISGAEGTGKTHLLHVFAAQTGAKIMRGVQAGLSPDAVASGPLAVDNADSIEDEEFLFHLYNLMKERDLPLLMAARTAPSRWNIRLPDLRSRLQSVTVIDIGPPDDMLLMAVLAKHFSDRGIAPPPNLIPYLVARLERSLSSAARIVAGMDDAAMKQGRPIGTRLAASVLDIQADFDA